jgi:hypothetical protein
LIPELLQIGVSKLDISSIKKKLSTTKFSVPDQAFRLECASLRPYTRYFVLFDQLDFTNFCVQDGKRLGDVLISDAYGKLNFTFYWNKQNEDLILSNKNFATIFDRSVGNKLLTITDKSGTSFVNKMLFFNNNAPDMMFTRYTQASNIVTT